jgi:excisionase family DNA binding protein
MNTPQEHCQRCRYSVTACKCRTGPLLEVTAARRPGDQTPLMTPAEVGALFRVDVKTVTRWAKAGKLRSIRTLGGHRRYREDEVRALLNGDRP